MTADWAVTPEKINAVVETIIREFSPEKIIQFGSSVHGTLSRNSDLDLLVVMKGEVPSRRRASVQMRSRVRGIIMPMDILVISDQDLQKVKETPGLIYREALGTGRILYEAA